MSEFSFGRRIAAGAVMLGALGFAACKSDSTDETSAVPVQTITVIGTADPESALLSDIYARSLENNGFRVARRAPVADLSAAYAALNAGGADLFITKTNDLLTFLAANEPAAASTSTTEVATTTTMVETTTTRVGPMPVADTTDPTDPTDTTTDDSSDDTTGDTTDPDASTTSVLAESTTTTIPTAGQASAISLNLQANQIGEILPDTLQVGAPSNAEDKPVIACKAEVTTGLTLLSDLATVSDTLRIAGTEEFETAEPFGLPGFEETYGAEFAQFVPVEAADVANAFAPVPEVDDTTSTTTTVVTDVSTETTVAEPIETDADCGAFASSLDPTITGAMVVLDDNKNWVTNNGVLPLFIAADSAGASQIIDQVSAALQTAVLRDMVTQVEGGADPSSIAGQWLEFAGLGG